MYPKIFQWTAQDNAAITAAAGYGIGALPLNGTLYNPNNSPSIVFSGFARVVSVTSNANIAAASFTINGYYNSHAVQSVITGVNANTVQGTQLFDYITSVSVNAVVANASVGIGQTGHTKWYLVDYNKPATYLSFQTIATATINYSLIATLQDVTTSTALSQLTVFDPTAGMTGLTATAFDDLSGVPVRYLCFKVNSSNATGALTAIILENG